MSAPVEVIFRCDFGKETGWGHVVRCSALARAIGSYQVATTLITNGQIEHLPESLTDAFNHIEFTAEQLPGYELWKNLLGDDSASKLIVVDSYQYGEKDIAQLRSFGPKLVVIDDDASRDLTDADLVVNSGLTFSHIDYPVAHRVLTGPAYALLRSEFRAPNVDCTKSTVNPQAVMLMIGGTDPNNLTPRLLEFLSNRVGENWHPILAGSRDALSRPAVSVALERFASHRCLCDAGPEELAEVMRTCAYGITACGGSVYEIAACGLPFLGVVVAENQEAMGSAIEKKWGLPILAKEELLTDKLSSKWNFLLGKYPAGIRSNIKELDGYGALRVAEAILRL